MRKLPQVICFIPLEQKLLTVFTKVWLWELNLVNSSVPKTSGTAMKMP